MQTTEPTYRKAAKAARAKLAKTLSSQGIDPKRGAHFETEKIHVRCTCGQKREAAKATALYMSPESGTSLILEIVAACTCKAENK